jgi:hypothetical protein
MQPTIKNWKPAAIVWQEFTRAHPELGRVGTANSWIHFQRRYAKLLIELGVIRVTGVRGTMIADIERFESVVFDLLTLGTPSVQAPLTETRIAGTATT